MDAAAAQAGVRATPVPMSLLVALNLTGYIWPRNADVKNNSFYDYIIVGGGTAGNIVANRLTEDCRNTVLVIDAGGDPPIDALLPGLFAGESNSSIDWKYESTFDSRAASSQNNRTKLTCGKVLGGSSSLNHFILARGARKDYDTWAEITNDRSWSYDNVLPYFIKSEHLYDPEVLNSPYGIYHGTKGPMGVTREPSNETKNYFSAFAQAGNDVVLDINGYNPIGYTQSMLTIAHGVRQSSAYSYLRIVRNRRNLYVLKNTLVIKIMFNKKNRAVAVRAIINNNLTVILKARKEIILSAGVFNTPQLLMLSGIGPRKHLESFNMSVIADLSVGDNMQDHVAVSLVHKMDKSIAPPPIPNPTEVGFPVIGGSVTIDKSQNYPDYQTFNLILPHDSPLLEIACAVVFGYRQGICDQFINDSKGRNTLYTLLAVLHPSSRGQVRLKSKDPRVPPAITTGFFTKDSDLENMVDYIIDFIRVGNTTFFKSVDAALIDLELPQCKNETYGSRPFWKCYILHTAVSLYHYTSTCPMSKVVDSKLRVYNVKKLRIVDASIMPLIPRANPNAAVVMIAEKASDMIKRDAKLRKCRCG